MANKKAGSGVDVESDKYKAAAADAQSAAEGLGASVIDKLADRIGTHSGARAVFGDAIERDGITVVPVAQSMWGSGAGAGEFEDDGSSAGGGGGAMSKPLGYIEITDHGVAFVPLQQPWQDIKVILGYAFAIWLVVRALNKILRG